MDIHSEILTTLKNIEIEKNVRILYACESGSRAWGFPSEDSDYDVRFIYANEPDWYLSVNVENKRDVIEKPINDILDVSGWDLRKALKLFYKSNPPLLEWLGSPIIYREDYATAQDMRDLAKTGYSAKACIYHYYNMAKSNYRSFLQGETVRVKKYFYVLRPLLAVRWLERNLGIVPTEFQTLVDTILTDQALIDDIYALIEQKKLGTELEAGPKIASINTYLESEMERLADQEFDVMADRINIEKLNSFFRKNLKEIWSPNQVS